MYRIARLALISKFRPVTTLLGRAVGIIQSNGQDIWSIWSCDRSPNGQTMEAEAEREGGRTGQDRTGQDRTSEKCISPPVSYRIEPSRIVSCRTAQINLIIGFRTWAHTPLLSHHSPMYSDIPHSTFQKDFRVFPGLFGPFCPFPPLNQSNSRLTTQSDSIHHSADHSLLQEQDSPGEELPRISRFLRSPPHVKTTRTPLPVLGSMPSFLYLFLPCCVCLASGFPRSFIE
jgi:hypothetical protein